MKNDAIVNDKREQSYGSRSRTGFSLLEVIVVMVVLLIGILAVARLFPGGFLTIQRTLELTNATSIAERQVRTIGGNIQPPEAMVALDVNGAIDSFRLPDNLYDSTINYFFNDVNHFRQVIGDAFRVPAQNAPAGGLHTLQFGPVANTFTTGANPTDSISVHGNALERTEQSALNVPVLRSDTQYGIDYDTLQIAFIPRVGTSFRLFTITYDYYVASGTGAILKTVPNSATTVIKVPDIAAPPAGSFAQPQWQLIFDGVNNIQPADFDATLKLRRESDVVSRKFTLKSGVPLSPNATFGWTPNDPYEYVWVSPQFGAANIGILAFNPAGYTQVVQTATGTQPLTAQVDYVTYDNHILREDAIVSATAPYSVKLALPFILTTGDFLPDQTAYNGMFLDNASPVDVLIVNIATGAVIGEWSNGAAVAGTFNLNARAGVITFDAATPNIANANLRVFYRAQKNWGVMVQKPSAHYSEVLDPMQVNYKTFYVGTDQGSAGESTRIYFAPCDAGKTILLGKLWIVDGAGNISSISNEAYKIGDNVGSFENVGASQPLPYVDITTRHGGSKIVADASAPSGRAVENVQGASIRARVAWMSAGRWRTVDSETILTQTPN